MGFDTIDINLVLPLKFSLNLSFLKYWHNDQVGNIICFVYFSFGLILCQSIEALLASMLKCPISEFIRYLGTSKSFTRVDLMFVEAYLTFALLI